MKTLFTIIALLSTSVSFSQTADTLLHENFETGGAAFTLNTSDMSGVSAAVGYNQWVVNDIYAGGNGNLVCVGIPTTFNVPATPNQPAVITGSATSNYLHISSDAAQSSGIFNCSYLAANGICGDNEYNFAAMNQDVITTGYDSVTVSFLWLNAGGANIYGELYYSTNSGSSWNLVSTPVSQYKNQNTWTTQTVTIPAFANQGTLRIGFRFVNEVSFTASDPGFGIDEFIITGKVAPAPVAAFSVSDSVICEGDCVSFTDLSTGNPTSWLWILPGSVTSFSNQQNPSFVCYLSAGTYDVTLIVENSSGTDTLTVSTITVVPTPQPVITVIGDTLVASPGFASYQWMKDAMPITGETNDTLIVTAGGSYTVNVTDSNGCFAAAPVVLMTTGLNIIDGVPFAIFPNPANEFIDLGGSMDIINLKIYDVEGRRIREIEEGKITRTINVSGLDRGVYLLIITGKNQNIYAREVIIAR